MKFKAVIFDFGNVIINIDVPRTFQAFSKLTGKKQAVIEKLVADNQLFRRYETGQFTDIEFREIVRQTVGFPLSDHEVDTAWNSLLLDIPEDRIQLLAEIRKKYPVYLLSNTNSIHIEASNNYLKKAFGVRHLNELFDQLFLSYEIGMWKPDADIYHHVLKTINLKPHEVLFFDDNAHNIQSARALGMNTILVEPPTSIIEYCKTIF
ncbi:HAD family phosphatase [Emticicia sp. TH156]|uniref:HAD family hydrolase n=1 Tax=Emticicia sp. TH156 TaxID=2067454 RepID=UPI000C789DB8|nr:HAD family phosphatase [Emticicia sp. TH156]PLK42996.1 HAD family phosphatase [Emticicia sp. TH156]